MTTEEATKNGNGNIVERIRKLLRLARDKGASENEAATALGMAQKLMLQHNIENVEEQVEDVAVRGDWYKYEVDKKWQQILVSSIAKLYNCRSVTRNDGVVRFYGKASNVLICSDTLEWVTEQVNALHKEGLKAFRYEQLQGRDKLSKFEYRDFRLSFKEACTLRIWQRVNIIVAAARNEIPSHMALVVIDQALAAAGDLMEKDGITKGRALRLRRAGYGTGAGKAAGDAVQLQHNAPKPRASKPAGYLK